MKKTFLTTTVIILTALAMSLSAQNRKERKILYNSSYNYEVITLGVGVDGTKLIKVWGYGKKPHKAAYAAKRNAVAAAIFRGFNPGGGAAATPAIIKSPDADKVHADFFKEFFSTGGKYLDFVTVSTDGAPGGKNRIKMKRMYKVAVSVAIRYDALRKYLEDKGIAKRLDSGF